MNRRVGHLEVDFLWSQNKVIVETDGYRYHRGRSAFEDDRRRDLELRDTGFVVVRLTYHQVIDEPTRIGASLKKTLAAAPAED